MNDRRWSFPNGVRHAVSTLALLNIFVKSTVLYFTLSGSSNGILSLAISYSVGLFLTSDLQLNY